MDFQEGWKLPALVLLARHVKNVLCHSFAARNLRRNGRCLDIGRVEILIVVFDFIVVIYLLI